MSDETPPPPLRLRPRVRENEPSPAPVPAPPEPVSPPPPPSSAQAGALTADEGLKRFRLKPKLIAEPEERKAEPDETGQPVPMPLPPMPVLAPDLPPTEVPPVISLSESMPLPVLPDLSGDGMPRLKLKAVSAEAAGPAVAPPTPALSSATIPGLPVSVPLPPPPTAPPPAMIGGVPRAPASMNRPPIGTRQPLTPVPAQGRPIQKKRGLIIAGLVVLPLLGCGLAYWFLGRGTPEPVPVPVRPQPIVVATPEPALSEDLPSANAGLGRPVSGAQDVPAMPTVAETPVPPRAVPKGPSAATTAAFRTWVDAVQISGVVSGSSPRAIINGRLVKMGDVIDPTQGIIFDGVDAEHKEVVFRTNNGLIGGKAY
jgi:hypothetical protein